MPKILIVNGPNLNLLGIREVEVYGSKTLGELEESLEDLARELAVELTFFQSNSEGEIIDFIHAQAKQADGMLINPAALTHYSYALRDAIVATDLPTVEVHLSNTAAREEFRQKSVITDICVGQISGFGFYGYAMALSFLSELTGEK